MKTQSKASQGRAGTRRRGAVLVKVAILVPVIMGMAAMGIDLSNLHSAKNELQRAADAAAVATAAGLGRVDRRDLPQALQDIAQDVVNRNPVQRSAVQLEDRDLVLGHASFDDSVNTYQWTGTAGNTSPNAVEVTLRRTHDSPSGPVTLFFGRVLGFGTADLTAKARSALNSRSIAVVFDDGDDMNDDSQLMHEGLLPQIPSINSSINNKQIWQDLGSPAFGNMNAWNALLTISPSKDALNQLALNSTPYPTGLGGSWSNFNSFVRNQVSPNSYRNKFGLQTFMDYINSQQFTINQSPQLAVTHQQPLYTEKQVVNRFVDYLETLGGSDQAALRSFNDSDHYRVAMTTDYEQIRERMNAMIAGYLGNTVNVGAGINMGRNSFTQGQADIRSVNRVIVLISDGGPTTGNDYKTQTEHAVSDGMTVYTISVGYNARPGQSGYDVMQWIADHGNGAHLNIPPTLDIASFDAQLQDFFERIRGPYHSTSVLIQ